MGIQLFNLSENVPVYIGPKRQNAIKNESLPNFRIFHQTSGPFAYGCEKQIKFCRNDPKQMLQKHKESVAIAKTNKGHEQLNELASEMHTRKRRSQINI